MDGEMPDYLLAKDLILQVSLSRATGIFFILMGQNMSTYGIYYVDKMVYASYLVYIYISLCVCIP